MYETRAKILPLKEWFTLFFAAWLMLWFTVFPPINLNRNLNFPTHYLSDNIDKSAAMTLITRGFGKNGQGVPNDGFKGLGGSLNGLIAAKAFSGNGILDTTYFSQDWLVQPIINTGGTTTASSAFYGTDFAENFIKSMTGMAISQIVALSQYGVGDAIDGKSDAYQSLIGGIGHAAIACASAAAQDQNCEAAAMAAFASKALTVGLADKNMTLEEVKNLSKHMTNINIVLSALASGGNVKQFQTTHATLTSQYDNNYLSHTQIMQMRVALLACESEECEASVVNRYFEISMAQNAELAACETRECVDFHRLQILTVSDELQNELREYSTGFMQGLAVEQANGELLRDAKIGDTFDGGVSHPFTPSETFMASVVGSAVLDSANAGKLPKLKNGKVGSVETEAAAKGVDLSNATVVTGRKQPDVIPATGKTEIQMRIDPATGQPTRYIEYGPDGQARKRVDLVGPPHNGVPTPHVVEYVPHTAPDGTVYWKPDSANTRPATSDEVPK